MQNIPSKKNIDKKWSSSRILMPNVPAILPSNLPPNIIECILLRAKLEAIEFKLNDLNSACAERIVAINDKKLNVREENTQTRARDFLFKQRQQCVSQIDKIYPIFRAPASFRIGSSKCSRKFYLPETSDNFIGLILGPRGESLKQLESQYGVQVSIRGHGSTRSTNISSTSFRPDDTEPLHCLIEASNEKAIDECIEELKQIITPVPDKANLRKQAQLFRLEALNGIIQNDVGLDSKENHPPWEDPSLNIKHNDMDDAATGLINQIDIEKDSKITVQEVPPKPKFSQYIINLNEFDISAIVPEPLPPGTNSI